MKNINKIVFGLSALLLASCSWVSEPTPGVTQLEDYFVSGQACIYNVNANYVPMAWEFNNTYYSEWFIGDVMSDDALKGGQNISDMAAAYELENFKSNADNEICYDFYGAQYQGIARCNLSLTYIPNVACDSDMNEELKERLLGECYFMRAYYYFRLVRAFGGVPLTRKIETGDWALARSSADSVYAQIFSDLENAEKRLWNKSRTGGPDMGRATKGAAQAMLVKTHLYHHDYEEAKQWAETFFEEQASEYSLVSDFASNFTLAGENNEESIFEIQYANEGTSDFNPGNGATRGTFTTILTRSRSTNMGDEGWGFNKPTHNLFNEYEDGDIRRDATIILLDEEHIGDADEYLGTKYLNRKTGSYLPDGSGYALKNAHNTRGVLNNKQIRLADIYLMYAEACVESGKNLEEAKEYLNKVRARVGMPLYPDYSFKVNGEEIAHPTLKEAIRHERRMELAMEGHRWFDLVRWGVAYEVMTAYMAQESPEARAEMLPFKKGVHELLPIPTKELQLNSALIQNPGY